MVIWEVITGENNSTRGVCVPDSMLPFKQLLEKPFEL